MYQYKISSIPEEGCKSLDIDRGNHVAKVMVLRQGNTILCYHNICPHTGTNLDWMPDQFLNASMTFIQCATHGALFRIEDGYCVSGPCAGQSLFPVEVKVEGDMFEIKLK